MLCKSCGKPRPLLFKEQKCDCAGVRPLEREHSNTVNAHHTSTVERVNQHKLFTQSLKATRSDSPLSVHEILPADTIIGGSFRIISVIGEGGMSVVYLVRHTTLNNQYALKVLSPDQVTEKSWLRFKTEAKILAALTHPTFVKVYDLCVHEQKFPFYSMDYLQGRTLEEMLVSQGPIKLETVIDPFLEVLDGLAYAHRNKVIHRDLKPANIMLCTRDGAQVVKILDFGISKFEGSAHHQNLTLAGDIFGSPSYMSPEQCAGEPADTRSDIYSLGCTLFEILTGYVPFAGPTAFDTALLHQEKDAPTMSTVSGREFAKSIEYVVGKCLHKNPAERYQSCKELALDLTRIKEGKDPLQYSGATIPPREAPNQTQGDLSTWLPVLFLVALLTLTVTASAVFLDLIKPRHNKTAPAVEGLQSTYTPIPIFGDAAVVQRPIGSQNQLDKYSTVGVIGDQKYRCFYFPKDTVIGIIAQRHKPNTRQEARGFIRYKYNELLEFAPNPIAAEFPNFVKRFQPGDIYTVRLFSSQSNDKMLAAVTQIPLIRSLELISDDGLTERSIDSLNKLQNLADFDAFGISLTGNTLAKATCWKHLKRFHWTGAVAPSAMLAKLRECRELTNLGLKNSNLTHSDFKTIAKISGLTMLQISGNKISPTDLAMLARLPHLQYLYADKCGIDKNNPVLKKFKKMKELQISKGEQIQNFVEP